MNPYVLIICSLVIGVVIGIYSHYRFMMVRAEAILKAHQEAFEERLTQMFQEHIVFCYSERLDGVTRLFEAETHKFICQGSSNEALVDAFHDRYPDKHFMLVADDPLVEEFGETE